MQKYKLTLSLLVALVVLLGAALVFRPSFVSAQQATPTPTPAETPAANPDIVRTVSVSANGTVTAAPDQATINLGVRTQSENADEALDENNERMATLIATLREAGVASRDIQTSDFSIYPQYETSTNGTSRITGYEVSNRLSVTVRNLANFGSILDATVEAGGNQIDGIEFGFSDPQALLDQAREAAMAEAERKATQLATLAGVQVGTVTAISESESLPIPIMARGMEQAAMDAAVPVEAGESAVTVSVQVTYELVP